MRVDAHEMRLQLDDATLVRRLQAGDERAFEAIFKRHHAALLSYCRHMLSSQDEGEDALQQAFIKAHQALLGGTVPRELRPWLYAIARNCCLTAITARRGRTGTESPLRDDTPALAGFSEEVHRREDLRELVAGIGRLPEDQRSALLLAELEDLDHRAIAAIVGCEVSKVKALVYQARSALIAERDARETPCQDIREQLAVAHGSELRRGPLRRHLKLCVGCRDFQLAVSAQRQSFGAILPVLPSAGLAAAILGHGAAHAIGAAASGTGIAGGAGAGLVSGGAGAGSTVGAGTAAGAVSTGAGTAATAIGASAGAGGGTGLGALLGGGLVTKLAVGGALVALAGAGTVAAHNRPAHAATHRVALGRLSSDDTSARADLADYVSSASAGGQGTESPAPLALVTGPVPSGASPSGQSTGLSALSVGSSLLPSAMPAPGLLPSSIVGRPVTRGTKGGAHGRLAGARTRRQAAQAALERRRLREAQLHRHAALRRARLRKAKLRRIAARRQARVGKALHRKPPPGKPLVPKPVVTPAPVPVAAHRKARPPRTSTPTPTPTSTPTSTSTSTSTSVTNGAPAENTSGESEGKAKGKRLRSTNGGAAASGSARGGDEAGKTAAGTETEGTPAGEVDETGSGARTTPSGKSHRKEHLAVEGQLPNL